MFRAEHENRCGVPVQNLRLCLDTTQPADLFDRRAVAHNLVNPSTDVPVYLGHIAPSTGASVPLDKISILFEKPEIIGLFPLIHQAVLSVHHSS